ncbi:poly(A) RNA polymerase, mitochondrial-like [Pecten maximus]|uniref:poly(A) RNA polymerase, mitochondrial-like n=1 Tax=Pecten maximus TaxID=6579 RepID=UPI00145815FB|nr:poly(A) RNA polymerase, mitochondrial-like [Pecten maximus]
MAATMCSGLRTCIKLFSRKNSFIQTLLCVNSSTHGFKTVKLHNDKRMKEQDQNEADNQQNLTTKSNKLGQRDETQFQRQQTWRRSLSYKKSYWSMIESSRKTANRYNAISETELQKVDDEIRKHLLVTYINKQSVILQSKNKEGQHWLNKQKRFTGFLNVGRSPFRIHDHLKDVESVDEQLLHLDTILKQGNHHQIVYFMVYNEIVEKLRKTLPDIPIGIHGSSVTKLGCKGGDLDIVVSSDQKTFQKIRQKLRKVVSLDLLSSIPYASVPIIKVRHIPSNIICDISVTRILKQSRNNPVINSEILYTMSTLDERFCSLVRIIKCWAAYQGLCREGPNPLPHGITWTMLTLFYLQQKKMLPAAKHLYEPWYLRKQSRDTTEDCSTGILSCPDKEKIRKFPDLAKELVVNDESLVDLLKGFCDYYSEFSFSNNWISVYDGKHYLRSSDFSRSHSAMVIPLEFEECSNKNVSKNVNSLVIKRMRTELRKLCEAIDRNEFVSVFETPTTPTRPRNIRKHNLKAKNAALQDIMFLK